MNPEAVAAVASATKRREPLSWLVNLRLSESDGERLRRLANEAGTSPTEAARVLVLRGIAACEAIEAKGAA